MSDDRAHRLAPDENVGIDRAARLPATNREIVALDVKDFPAR
jgi:hypothetical protein